MKPDMKQHDPFAALLRKPLIINGAGEGNRTLVIIPGFSNSNQKMGAISLQDNSRATALSPPIKSLSLEAFARGYAADLFHRQLKQCLLQ